MTELCKQKSIIFNGILQLTVVFLLMVPSGAMGAGAAPPSRPSALMSDSDYEALVKIQDGRKRQLDLLARYEEFTAEVSKLEPYYKKLKFLKLKGAKGRRYSDLKEKIRKLELLKTELQNIDELKKDPKKIESLKMLYLNDSYVVNRQRLFRDWAWGKTWIQPIIESLPALSEDLEYSHCRKKPQYSCRNCAKTLTQKRTSFAGLAKSLGLPLNENDNCPYNRVELTNLHYGHLNQTFSLDYTIIANNNKKYEKAWNCIELLSGLARDSFCGCIPSLSDAYNAKVKPRKIEGAMRYMGFIAKQYRYDVDVNDMGEKVVTLRIHFKGDLIQDTSTRILVAANIKEAEDIWNDNAPYRGVKFKFKVVNTDAEAHFSVGLDDKFARRQYDDTWSTNFNPNTFAHEIGHMLGLDDEYNMVGSVLDENLPLQISRQCLNESLMCNNYSGRPSPYHYYLILRRAQCAMPSTNIDYPF